MKQLSIVIPFYNDVETLIGTISSIYDTIDIDDFEIILVNDGSQEKLPSDYPLKPNITYIEHFFNVGVGQAFDTGVRAASSEHIFLVGADIRFEKNGWASRMLKVVDKHPKSIICTTCKSYTTNRREYGADIIFYADNTNLSASHIMKNDNSYRTVLHGKWRPQTDRGVYQIPSLMGTFYGTTKEWYDHVRGFNLHYKWGVLEPYISLKTWLLGGEILIDTDNETQHIWRTPNRAPDLPALVYNQMMIASTVFGTFGQKYADYLYDARVRGYDKGSELFGDKAMEIFELFDYLKNNQVMTPEELELHMVDLSYEYSHYDRYLNPVL